MIKKLWPYTQGYRKWVVLGVLCSASEAVFKVSAADTIGILPRVGLPHSLKAVRFLVAHNSKHTVHTPGPVATRRFQFLPLFRFKKVHLRVGVHDLSVNRRKGNPGHFQVL